MLRLFITALNESPEQLCPCTQYTIIVYHVFSADPTAVVSSSSTSIEDGTTAVFTCNITGYPVDSVTVSSRSLTLDCLAGNRSGDATCVQKQTGEFVISVETFSTSEAGNYKCSVTTKWYKTGGTVMGRTAEDTIELVLGKIL